MAATRIVLTADGDQAATIAKVTAALKQMQAAGMADAGLRYLLSQPSPDEEAKARLLCDVREALRAHLVKAPAATVLAGRNASTGTKDV